MRRLASVLGVLVCCSVVCAQVPSAPEPDSASGLYEDVFERLESVQREVLLLESQIERLRRVDPNSDLIERLESNKDRYEQTRSRLVTDLEDLMRIGALDREAGPGVVYLLPTDPPQVLGMVDDKVWRMPVIPLGEADAGMNVPSFVRTELPPLGPAPAIQPAPLNLHRIDFVGDRDDAVARFRSERARLGDDAFVAQLTAWAKADPRRMYWSGAFLTSPSYLNGDTALPFVAIALWSEASTALDTGEVEDEMQAVSMRVLLAIEAQRLGLHATAREHKGWVEERFEDDERMLGSFPALTPGDHGLYEGIEVALAPEAEPALTWGRARPKLTVGMSPYVERGGRVVVEFEELGVFAFDDVEFIGTTRVFDGGFEGVPVLDAGKRVWRLRLIKPETLPGLGRALAASDDDRLVARMTVLDAQGKELEVYELSGVGIDELIHGFRFGRPAWPAEVELVADVIARTR